MRFRSAKDNLVLNLNALDLHLFCWQEEKSQKAPYQCAKKVLFLPAGGDLHLLFQRNQLYNDYCDKSLLNNLRKITSTLEMLSVGLLFVGCLLN